jgi:putative adhesin
MDVAVKEEGAAPLFREMRSKKRFGSFLALPLAVALAGCDVSLGNLSAHATDEWTHTYPLTAGGEVRIVNTNGRIDVEGVEGTTLEVRAERIARGATDAAARELLPRIVIKEDAGPDRVSLETERMSGFMIGASFEVRYHVRAPKNAVVNVTNTNGQVVVNAVSGKVIAHTTNGAVKGTNLTGGVDGESTNGSVSIDMASLGSERISLETTNGSVTLMLPEKAKATVSASVTNGGITIGSLDNFEVTEKSRRRLEGKMNGGGTEVELHTTNGGIRVRSRDTVNTRTDTDTSDKDKSKNP